MNSGANGEENYFDHDAAIGIIGRGDSIENCFANAAQLMLSLMIDLQQVHLTQIITFEFEEEDIQSALITWLNLLIEKSREHHLMFGDFRLKKEGKKWSATVSGERWRETIERGVAIKAAILPMLSVKKIDHLWEARCVIDV